MIKSSLKGWIKIWTIFFVYLDSGFWIPIISSKFQFFKMLLGGSISKNRNSILYSTFITSHLLYSFKEASSVTLCSYIEMIWNKYHPDICFGRCSFNKMCEDIHKPSVRQIPLRSTIILVSKLYWCNYIFPIF